MYYFKYLFLYLCMFVAKEGDMCTMWGYKLVAFSCISYICSQSKKNVKATWGSECRIWLYEK